MDKDNDEVEAGPTIGTMFFIGAIFVITIVGFSIYQMISGPYTVADNLREHINHVNCSDDYRQGWLDCVNYWLDMNVGCQNCTSN